MKKSLFYIAVLLTFLINSCCFDPACPELSDEEASWFPYGKYDTLFFSSKLSDSIIYFPIESNNNGSYTFVPYNSNECHKSCRAQSYNYSACYFNNTEIFNCTFLIDKVDDNLYVVISPYGGISADFFSPEQYFDYRKATILDSYNINGNQLSNVYQYICYPEQEQVAETYVKKGMGLVKIVFRNGQEFELVEHRKAE